MRFDLTGVAAVGKATLKLQATQDGGCRLSHPDRRLRRPELRLGRKAPAPPQGTLDINDPAGGITFANAPAIVGAGGRHGERAPVRRLFLGRDVAGPGGPGGRADAGHFRPGGHRHAARGLTTFQSREGGRRRRCRWTRSSRRRRRHSDSRADPNPGPPDARPEPPTPTPTPDPTPTPTPAPTPHLPDAGSHADSGPHTDAGAGTDARRQTPTPAPTPAPAPTPDSRPQRPRRPPHLLRHRHPRRLPHRRRHRRPPPPRAAGDDFADPARSPPAAPATRSPRHLLRGRRPDPAGQHQPDQPLRDRPSGSPWT